jgi:ATP-dependent Lon protease
LPGLSFSINLTQRSSVELIRSLVKVRTSHAASRTVLTSCCFQDVSSGSSGLTTATPLLVGCVPLRPKKSEEASGADREGKAENGEKGALPDNGEEGPKKEMKALFTSKEKGSIPGGLLSGERPMPEELFERSLNSLFFLFPPTLIFVIRVDGVVARISRLERVSNSSGGGFVVVVEGLSRFTFNVSALSTSSPFYTSLVELQDTAALPSSHTPLISSLRSTATSLLATLSRSSVLPPLFLHQLRNLLAALNHDNAPALVDAFIGTLPLSSSLTFADKLLILSLVDGVARVEKGIELFLQIDETLKLSKRLGERVEQDAQKRAKQFALMQQLLALRKELAELGAEDKTGAARGAIIPSSRAGSKRTSSRPPPLVSGDAEEEEEDEMDVLEKKIAAKAFSPEAREVALKELGRLKKTPPQGAEHGIIRTLCLFSFPHPPLNCPSHRRIAGNYIDTLLSLPWTTTDATPLPSDGDFLAKARKKLDADHYGLEKIKKRLIEWLAVLRLQQLQEAPSLAVLSSPSTPSPGTETALSPSTDSTLAPSTETAVVLRDPSTPSAPTPTQQNPVSAARKHPAPLLLLHGPPGTGKTSIAASLAVSMGRKFVRVSLGGVTDEAAIRGHRRT